MCSSPDEWLARIGEALLELLCTGGASAKSPSFAKRGELRFVNGEPSAGRGEAPFGDRTRNARSTGRHACC
jgi:hypothetical protein